MKLLKDILYKLDLNRSKGNINCMISHICFDSRQVQKGSLFVAIKGTITNGHTFISQAIYRGAVAIVFDEEPNEMQDGIVYVHVRDTSIALGLIASNFYDNPSKKLKLIGVTGTNGKTTVASLLYKLFMALGHKSGLISTVEYKIGEKSMEASHTTPNALHINSLLANMWKEGCTYSFMEVSSHAIDQERIYGLDFDLALFTNITRDHLDYHKTFDKYILAKKKFFDGLSSHATAIVNNDDIHGETMLHHCVASKKTFGLRTSADYICKIKENQFSGLHLSIQGQDVFTRLIGTFNAANLLLTYAAAVELEEDSIQVLTVLSSLNAVEGRFEQTKSSHGFTAIVDYAHTPDALKNVLKTIVDIKSKESKLVCLVGCGGDRDEGKRSLIGQVACDWADQIIFTSDNPRSESAESIIQQMKQELSNAQLKKVLSIRDRAEAIRLGIALCTKDDVLLVAGKGHEKYQEIHGERLPFDDMAILKEHLND
jgi:UDP-N-acetylmuramoyl-L-alanyl-D-glutamate--2,6-diaminopimelate ligase